MHFPEAFLSNSPKVDVVQTEPLSGPVFCRFDVKSLIIIRDEQPFVMVDPGICQLSAERGAAVCFDGVEVSNGGFRCRVKIVALDERDRYVRHRVFDNSVFKQTWKRHLCRLNRIRENGFILSVDVNRAADFLADRETATPSRQRWRFWWGRGHESLCFEYLRRLRACFQATIGSGDLATERSLDLG
jgi:hypothetical protein